MTRRRTVVLGLIGMLAAGAGGIAWARRRGAVEPPPMRPPMERSDRILVEKKARRMVLFRAGEAIRAYDIALGFGDPGDKAREGDGRTPEGRYAIGGRNPRSAYHLSLRIDYPRPDDIAAARARGEDPGGDIIIHGLPNGLGWLGADLLPRDWTDGCIAVTDEEIREIWSLVPDGTPIEIKP